VGWLGGKIRLETYCSLYRGFWQFLHVKFYFGFQSDKMLENVVFSSVFR